MICPDCSSNALPDEIGRIVCLECKSPFVQTMDQYGIKTLKEHKEIGSVRMRKPENLERIFNEITNSITLAFKKRPVPKVGLECSFCGCKVERVNALVGRGKPRMSVEQEIVCLDPFETKDKYIFNSPTLISCPDCCLIKHNGEPVKYKHYIEPR